jgi:hypothetical protein
LADALEPLHPGRREWRDGASKKKIAALLRARPDGYEADWEFIRKRLIPVPCLMTLF